MEGIPEEFFLSEDYALFTETIGDHTQEFYALPSACTDYDLTGQVIWPGSKILASYLIKNCSIISEKAVLELGSGPGLTGLICSYFTKRMILSDGNDVILRLLERNKIYAHSDVEVCKIEWGLENSSEILRSKNLPDKYEVIIGSDVIYSIDAVIPLFDTVKRHLEDNGEFLMAYTARAMNNHRVLINESTRLDFAHEVIFQELNNYIYSFKKIKR